MELARAEEVRAAGKSTTMLNNSSFARYTPAQKNTLIIESYTRPLRKEATGMRYGKGESSPAMWQAMQYDTSAQWKPEQGVHTTRFGRGFARRPVSAINPFEPRVHAETARAEKQAGMTEFRRAYLEDKLTFKGSGYNILTGEETGGSSKPMRYPERRHSYTGYDRSTGPGCDKPAFRLKDSTSRFFADSQQMPMRPQRTANLMREGIDPAQRTSTIIGVGKTIRHEIPSAGARDAFVPEPM
ncbi:hypothetical protein KFE25_007653 [Diacronema lutheri]|uniref:Uncharacterized protein n=1 Tax=Diacronema lutheri TaxID=2081491 RepID=A0A8J5Y0P9_DIALT|nr:hypothetical protein KFE25_007653 [Diacronema lutheri]